MFKFHVGCRDVQTAFSSVPLNACRVTTSTSSTPKRRTTKKQKKTPRLQPADVRSLSTTHSSPSSPAVTKSDCEVGWNWTQDTSVIRRWLVCQYQWCGKEIGTRKTFITSDVVTERKAAIQASLRISFVLKHSNYFLCLINLPSCWLRMKVKGCNLLTRRPAKESDRPSYSKSAPPEAEHPNVSRSSTDVSTAQAQMLSATATDITGSSAGSLRCARRSRSYFVYIYNIYIDLFGLHNLYLFSNWILNPQLKLTNKMSWCPRYYWGDIQIISNNHYIPIALECPNPAQPRTRSRRQRSALLPCTRRSQSFTAPSWCSKFYWFSTVQLQLHLLNVGWASGIRKPKQLLLIILDFSRSPSKAFPASEHHLDNSGHLYSGTSKNPKAQLTLLKHLIRHPETPKSIGRTWQHATKVFSKQASVRRFKTQNAKK